MADNGLTVCCRSLSSAVPVVLLNRWHITSATLASAGDGALGRFGFLFGPSGGVAGVGAGFDLGPGPRQRGLALLPAGDFRGNHQAFLHRRGNRRDFR